MKRSAPLRVWGLWVWAVTLTSAYAAQTPSPSVQQDASLAPSVNLVQTANQQQQQERRHQQHREAAFVAAQQEAQRTLRQLTQEQTQLQKEVDQLTQIFRANDTAIGALETKREQDTGSLGEVFGVVRQQAKSVVDHLKQSAVPVSPQALTLASQVATSDALPSLKSLSDFWQLIVQHAQQSGQIAPLQVPYIDAQGQKQTVDALRLGTFGLITQAGYVRWDAAQQAAMAFPRQPDHGPTLASVNDLKEGHIHTMVIDPSQGKLIAQLALTPSLWQRVQAGGGVGYVILGLLTLGLFIALGRGIVLFRIDQHMKRQLKQPHQPQDNPLGRVLRVYQQERRLSVEALELRLLEAVLDEQTHLEKGLSMLKLLAALAPMLGLLGTVTGMIETFQVITQFGNGDPKIMASGISMALVTTVLGLIAAMPLLLAHNILSSQSERIRQTLEKQGVGLVAAQAEHDLHLASEQAA